MEKTEKKENTFIEYLKKSKVSIAIILLFIVFAFGERIISQSFSIDTELYIKDIGQVGRWNWWMSLNRWGLVLLNIFFQMNTLPIFASNFLTVVFIIGYSILFNYLFYTYIKNEYKELFIKFQFIFPIIFVTNPIFAEQYNFILQNIGVAFTIFLIPCILLLLDKLQEKNIKKLNKVIGYMISIGLLILSFGVYQSVILLYIATVVVCYLLKVIRDNDNSWKYLIRQISIFILSAGIYLIIGKIISNGSTSYLQSAWLKDSFLQCITNIWYCIKSVLKCETIFYNIGYLISIVVIITLIVYLILKKKMKIGVFISTLGLILAPFYIMIITGVDQLKRTQFNYSFVVGVILLLAILFISKFKKLKILRNAMIIISVLIAYTQSYYCANLFHTVDITYHNDEMFAQKLVDKIEQKDWFDSEKDYKIIFVGRHQQDLKNVYLKSEVMGRSFFEFDYEYIYGLNDRAVAFLNILGYPFNRCTEEEFENAKQFVEENSVEIWPNKECIQLKDDNKIIVRLSKEY